MFTGIDFPTLQPQGHAQLPSLRIDVTQGQHETFKQAVLLSQPRGSAKSRTDSRDATDRAQLPYVRQLMGREDNGTGAQWLYERAETSHTMVLPVLSSERHTCRVRRPSAQTPPLRQLRGRATARRVSCRDRRGTKVSPNYRIFFNPDNTAGYKKRGHGGCKNLSKTTTHRKRISQKPFDHRFFQCAKRYVVKTSYFNFFFHKNIV